MLARRHVAKLLADYYGQPANSVVGSVLLTEGDFNFKALWGEFHYRRKVASLYAKQEGRWLTSVELMRPYYSKSIANFVAEQAKGDGRIQDFDIVEVGGGRATNASIIMTQLQKVHPHVYERVNSYTMIDASPSLLALQRDTMRNTDHFDKMKFELKDMIDVAEKREPFLTPNETPTVFIACELLDNLPHDKVRIKGGGELVDQAEIISSKESGGSPQEVFVPLTDPLLSQVLKFAPEYTQDIQAWIPTVACGVLHQLRQDRPNATLMLADFDWLPPPDLTKEQEETQRSSSWAAGEPIVTDMQGNDHPCYIQSPDHCDILFPTDFSKLASFVSKCWNVSSNKSPYQVDVHKQSDFLQLYGPEQVEATRSWLTQFTPLLHDFANCSVLTVSHRAR